MSASELFCPRCGSENDGDTRYCRRCGTNLEVVAKALATPALADEDLSRAQRALRMRLVRGLGLFVLAAGSGKALLALIASVALGGAPVALWAILGLILFACIPSGLGALAVRDLLEAYELRKDPRNALPGRSHGLEAPPREFLSAPPTLAEQTTLPLEPSSDRERHGR